MVHGEPWAGDWGDVHGAMAHGTLDSRACQVGEVHLGPFGGMAHVEDHPLQGCAILGIFCVALSPLEVELPQGILVVLVGEPGVEAVLFDLAVVVVLGFEFLLDVHEDPQFVQAPAEDFAAGCLMLVLLTLSPWVRRALAAVVRLGLLLEELLGQG